MEEVILSYCGLKWQAQSINSEPKITWVRGIYSCLLCLKRTKYPLKLISKTNPCAIFVLSCAFLFFLMSSHHSIAAQLEQRRTSLNWNVTVKVNGYKLIWWTKGQTSNRCFRLLFCHIAFLSSYWVRNKWRKGTSKQHRIFNIYQWLHIRRQLLS